MGKVVLAEASVRPPKPIDEGFLDSKDRHFVVKDWGWESWITNNDLYCGKILFVKCGKQCSWHYHKIKDEVLYIAKGKVLFIWSSEDDIDKATRLHLNKGDAFRVSPGMRHRFYGSRDSYIYEFSTQHFDEDTVRLIKSG